MQEANWQKGKGEHEFANAELILQRRGVSQS